MHRNHIAWLISAASRLLPIGPEPVRADLQTVFGSRVLYRVGARSRCVALRQRPRKAVIYRIRFAWRSLMFLRCTWELAWLWMFVDYISRQVSAIGMSRE